jgi:hypothetical protein
VTDSVQDTSSATTTFAPIDQLGEETAHNHAAMLESKIFQHKKGEECQQILIIKTISHI